MESSRLATFYKNSGGWPRNTSELAATAEKLRQLLECACVFFQVGGLGVRVAGLGESEGLRESQLENFVRSQVQALPALAPDSSTPIQQTQLSGAFPFRVDRVQVQYVSMIPITGWVRGEPGSKGPSGVLGAPGSRLIKRDFGWIVCGTSKPMSHREELLLLAAANHLLAHAIGETMNDELALRDQFLSIASHELKTPLTSIYGILQLQERMLRTKPGVSNPEQEKQRSFFKIVIRQVERLNELIDGLLDVSRIQNGRFMVEPGETDVTSILRETVETRLQIIASEAGVRIHVDAPEKLTAWVDSVRFEEVVTNLLMNAIRFSPEGGVVWVRLREENGNFVFSVRDQGPTVSAADRERIFQPFERAQRTSRLGGLGLGLFISRQIAQLHHGNVTLAEGLPGRGNVIEARFPLREVQAEATRVISA